MESRTYRIESRRKRAATAESDCAVKLLVQIVRAIGTYAIQLARRLLLVIPAGRPLRL